MPNPTNHILTATLTATTTLAGRNVNALKDGYGNYGGSGGQYWMSASGSVTNQAIVADLGSAKTFDTLEVVGKGYDATTRPQNYEVYVSDDGVAWGAAIASGAFANNDLIKTVTFASQTKQWIKLLLLDNYGSASYIGELGELRLFVGATDLLLASHFELTTGITGAIGNYSDGNLAAYTYATARDISLQFDFTAAKWVDSFLYINSSACTAANYSAREWYIMTSTDGVTWKEFYRTPENASPSYPCPILPISFPKINTRYLGLFVRRNFAGDPRPLVSQLRVYDQVAPTAWAGISSLVAETLKVKASWTAYEAAACKAYRVYIRSGSAPDAFGTSSAYFLCELENDVTSISIGTLADKTTALVPGTQYYVIVRPVFNDDTESSDTTCLNQTPNAAAGGGGAFVF